MIDINEMAPPSPKVAFYGKLMGIPARISDGECELVLPDENMRKVVVEAEHVLMMPVDPYQFPLGVIMKLSYMSGLSIRSITVLAGILRHGPMSTAAIAQLFDVTPAAVQLMLQPFRHLLETRAVPDDRRSHVYGVTMLTAFTLAKELVGVHRGENFVDAWKSKSAQSTCVR